ncbi:MAG: hypothetical protein ACR2P4_06995, partial [Gammaproteobacteria bacterium]
MMGENARCARATPTKNIPPAVIAREAVVRRRRAIEGDIGDNAPMKLFAFAPRSLRLLRFPFVLRVIAIALALAAHGARAQDAQEGGAPPAAPVAVDAVIE